MKAYQVTSDGGIEAIKQVELADPQPARGQVVVALRAASLNYRDLFIAGGGYPLNDTKPVIPLSDGAGEVFAVGEGVEQWQIGDRVIACFMRDWVAGPMNETALMASLGGGVDGVLAEKFVMPAHALVRIPEHLDFEEAATLPCAALVAWNGLTQANTRAGETVLMIGTGGVATFGIQLVRALGGIPVIISSNEENLKRAKELGAEHTINYTVKPEWDQEVLRLTNGRGVDHVLETGGAGTLPRSINATRVGGTITLIGVVAQGDPPPLDMAMFRCLRLQGVCVGSVEMLESMCRAIAANAIRPVIAARFDFEDAIDAYRSFASERRFGKVVITNTP
ncbi:MAG: NAD(P)-dependent alcohol dehydrogenase [Planctomycetota bacterium]